MMEDPVSTPKLKKWPYFFILSLVEGILAFVSLIFIPHDVESGILFGFSRTRLAIMLTLLIVLVVLAVLLWLSWRRPDWSACWLDPRRKPRLYAWLHATSVIGMFAAGSGLIWLRYWDPEHLMALFIRAQPPLVFLLVFCVQFALWLLFLRSEAPINKFLLRRDVYTAGLIVFAIFLAVAIFIATTGIGITPDTAYWAEPGVPLLAWQTVLAIIGGWLMLMLGLNNWIDKHGRSFDLLLGIALWGLAFCVWMHVPLTVLEYSFYGPIRPPYTTPFPYSDAGMYDYLARTLLLGNGLLGWIPPRPLYIVFLAGIHAIFGNSYAQTVLGQTLVLAMFPVVLYFLGKKLHSRGAGLTAGLLVIFRELNTLWVSSETQVSNSKLFLSDLPTALGAAAFLLLAVHWLTKKERRLFDAFLAGGVFGLLLLLRTQIVFTLAGLVMVGLFGARCPWKRWLANAAIFVAGMILAVAPWVVRNWVVTGSPALDDPSQIYVITSMYISGDLYPDQNIAAMMPAEATHAVVDVIIHQPGYVARFVTAHFLANEIDTLLVLPLTGIFEGLNAPIDMYWLKWDEILTKQNVIVLVFYLAFLAIGIGASWKNLGWVGILPLLFNMFYSLSNGMARISGWRYILPMDWVGYFYFGIGVIELLAGFALIFGGQPSRLFYVSRTEPSTVEKKPARSLVWKVGIAAIVFALIGGLPVIMEYAIPPHFNETSVNALTTQLTASPAAQSAEVDTVQVLSFASQPEAVLVSGQLIYPRFFWANRSMASGHPWPIYASRDYPRMGFILLTRENVIQAVLPLEDIPENFPPDRDVLMLGCNRGDFVEVRMLLFLPDELFFSSGSLSEGCDIP